MQGIRKIALATALAVLVGACGSSDESGQEAAPAATDAPQGQAASTTTTVPPSTADAAARPSTGCHGLGDMVLGAATDEVLDVDGAERTWLQFVPTSYNGTTPLPVVIQMHGLSQPHTTVEVMAGYQALGETEGFIVLTPAGRADPIPFWAATTAPDNPDLEFFDALLDTVGTSLCIDEARVYASGMSNGGLMSFTLACALSDRLAAVAPVAGVVLPEPCDLARPIPIIAFYGDEDLVLPFDGGLGGVLEDLSGRDDASDDAEGATGGDANGNSESATGDSMSAPDDHVPTIPNKIAAWASHLGCEAEPTIERVSDEVRLESWTSCDGDAELLFYVVEGGGHSWPGSPGLLAAQEAAGDVRTQIMGYTTPDISATELAWEFFQQHALLG